MIEYKMNYSKNGHCQSMPPATMSGEQ